MGAQINQKLRPVRTARGLARLFEFEEFEDKFENCLDMLRPFGWRRMTESGLERSGEHAESCTSFLAKRFPGSEATRELVLENEGWREMTESGLERSGKRLRVAFHSTKWILEGGAGGRTGPREKRGPAPYQIFWSCWAALSA